VHGREVLECPGAEKFGDEVVMTRTLWVGPSQEPISMLLGQVKDANSASAGGRLGRFMTHRIGLGNEKQLIVGGGGGTFVLGKTHTGSLFWGEKEATVTKLYYKMGGKDFKELKFLTWLSNTYDPSNLSTLLKGGPKRWGDPLATQGTLAKDDAKSAYVV